MCSDALCSEEIFIFTRVAPQSQKQTQARCSAELSWSAPHCAPPAAGLVRSDRVYLQFETSEPRHATYNARFVSSSRSRWYAWIRTIPSRWRARRRGRRRREEAGGRHFLRGRNCFFLCFDGCRARRARGRPAGQQHDFGRPTRRPSPSRRRASSCDSSAWHLTRPPVCRTLFFYGAGDRTHAGGIATPTAAAARALTSHYVCSPRETPRQV